MLCPLLTDPLDPLVSLGPTHIPTDHPDSDNFEIREKLGKMTTEILSNKKMEYMVMNFLLLPDWRTQSEFFHD